jgi:hypothetical protein
MQSLRYNQPQLPNIDTDQAMLQMRLPFADELHS